MNLSPQPGRFPHVMLKEIYEQPRAISETIQEHTAGETIFPSELSSLEATLTKLSKMIIAASGSSRHAGLAGEIVIEDLSGVAVDVEYSSEYSYRSTHAVENPLVMVITQSGETADTIAAQREAASRGAKTIAISNVAGSTIAREASATLLTYAGDERAVPATKSFTAQLTLLHLFALYLSRKRGRMSAEQARNHLARLKALPETIANCLDAWSQSAREIAARFYRASKFLYLGRGVHYAIAREGALKLKEISYAHAEGYPAGELKHGPNALVDESLPVVVVATCDRNDADSMLRYEKTLSVIEEIRRRSGSVIAIATEGSPEVKGMTTDFIFVPPTPELLLPIIEIIPLQLFAYHVAVMNGCDVDHPRNLVKAVVTE